MARKRNPFPGETGIHPVCNGHNRLPHPDVTNCKVHNPIIIINSVMKIVIIFIIISILPCCSDIDSQYFNGEIKEVNVKNVISKNINSTHVPIKGIATGIIAAYDSLLICWSPSYPEHFFNIINIDTGKEIGYFCKKGQGNKEIITTNCISQLFKKNDKLMTLLHAPNEKKLLVWDLSSSIKKGTTTYDTIIPYDNNHILFSFYQIENVLFAYKPAEEINSQEATTPHYEKRTIYTNQLIQDFPIYKTKSIQNPNAKSPLDFFFYTWDAIKPDGSKIVQVMRHLPQINIIDTQTGKITSYRIKNNPNFSLLETSMESMNVFYNHVHADDNYIYATYWGKEPWDDRFGVEVPILNTIHVFDWHGNLLYKLTTDKSFFRVWSDPVRKRLYTIDMNTDEVYYIDLKEL